MDAISEEDFNDRLQNLKTIWTVRDANGEFARYVDTELVDVMKRCLTVEARTKAGLGSSPGKFYTNQAESVNFRLKCCTGFRESGLLAFVQTMHDYANTQEEEVKKAYCKVSKK